MSEYKCPIDGCDKTSDTQNGLSIHYGRADDSSHPGKLSERNEFNPSKSAETKRKMSDSTEERWSQMSEAERKKIAKKASEKMSGRTLSDETKEKISKSLQGRDSPTSEEQAEKISDTLKDYYSKNEHPTEGREVDQETRNKISETLSGRERSEEATRKSASSMEKVWAKRSDEEIESLSQSISQGVIEAGANGTPNRYKLEQVEELDHGVRSEWEKQVAFALNNLDVEYEYEKRFDLRNGREYRPDFTVGNVVIEVKGVPTFDAEMKAKEFMELYPERRYVVVGNRLWYCDEFVPYSGESNVDNLNKVIQ